MKLILLRFSGFIFLALAVAVMIFGKANPEKSSSLKMGVADAASGIIGVISNPVQAVASLTSYVSHIESIYEENTRLKSENEQLRKWQEVATALESENVELKKLTNFVDASAPYYISARLLASGSGPFTRSALVDTGTNLGVQKGMAVISESGLIGSISEAGDTSARVMLFTDINSRIPVITESSREKCILAGDNTETPKLLYVPQQTTISDGERVLTSGDGGFFPAGLPVGVVKKNGDNGYQILPFANMQQLEYVTVVDYRFEEPGIN